MNTKKSNKTFVNKKNPISNLYLHAGKIDGTPHWKNIETEASGICFFGKSPQLHVYRCKQEAHTQKNAVTAMNHGGGSVLSQQRVQRNPKTIKTLWREMC